LIRIQKGKEFHSNFGIIKHDAIIGTKFGSICRSPSSEVDFVLLKPLLHELATTFARKTQIVYPKDIGFIIIKCGIRPHSRVLEAGTGSGSMTMMLSSIIDQDSGGKIISYDVEVKHHRTATKNLEKAGLLKNVNLRVGNIFEKDIQALLIEDEEFDACFFDLPSPWDIVQFANKILQPCGVFCSFSPVIEQVKKTVSALKLGKWYDVEVIDLQARLWQVQANATRPISHGRHTGYLVFARKILAEAPMAWNRKSRKRLRNKLEKEGKIAEEIKEGSMAFFNKKRTEDD
jgi:tRNA (adenine57-N1/adenine58-N1)-methyltransferase